MPDAHNRPSVHHPSTRRTVWSGERPSRVQLFVTCLVDHLRPEVGWATVTVLERLGVSVIVPAGQTCCGQPAFNGGFRSEALAMARQTIEALEQDEAPVVVPSGSCAEMIVHHYPTLFAGQPGWYARAKEVADRTWELTEFLVDVLGATDLGAVSEGPVAYHASCHGLRGLRIGQQPWALLREVRGADFRDLPGAEVCCGFGGLFSVKMAPVSGAMLASKLEDIVGSGAAIVTATDVSCLMHIEGGLRRRGVGVRVKHIAEVLAARGEGK